MAKDNSKTKAQLISELEELRQRVSELEKVSSQGQQAKAGFHESDECFKQLSESRFEGIAIHDNGILIDANRHFFKLFGYNRDELIGKNVIPITVAFESIEYLKKQVDTHFYKPYEVKCIRKDGTEFPAEIIGRTINYHGQKLRFVSIKNITESKIAEEEKTRDELERKKREKERMQLSAQLQEKNRDLEEILFFFSHDLKSPLVSIQGFSDILDISQKKLLAFLTEKEISSDNINELSHFLEKNIANPIRFITSSVIRMQSIFAGFLKLARMGTVHISLKKIDIDLLLAGICREFELKIKDKNISLKVDKLPACTGDREQIFRVFFNILDNAVKYLDPARPGNIVVSGRVENERAIYCIEDNGIGIEEKQYERIFQMFRRLNPQGSEGDGLGMTIVRKILNRQDGKVWLQSEPGKGSKFFFSLPEA
ncbi:ATP-binding protein [Candidatus Riflebacteria bacterium]